MLQVYQPETILKEGILCVWALKGIPFEYKQLRVSDALDCGDLLFEEGRRTSINEFKFLVAAACVLLLINHYI